MAHVCPWWVGYLLVNPLRYLLEPPEKVLGPHLGPGMKVLEVGPGMGYFTLPAARLVGPRGVVVAVDVQDKMLASLRRRAEKAGLAGRIEARLAGDQGLGVEHLAGGFDVALLIHVVHEIPEAEALWAQVAQALMPGGRAVFIEPPHHVKEADFAASLEAARAAGLRPAAAPGGPPLEAVLVKQPGGLKA